MNRNHVFDSNGPDLRIRGTAQQLFEKYLQLGRDAASSIDRVMAESYFQHAEHYFRILTAMNQVAQQGQQNGQNNQNGQNGGGQPQARRPMDLESELEEESSEPAPPGLGDQPSAIESREIPIAAAPPEG